MDKNLQEMLASLTQPRWKPVLDWLESQRARAYRGAVHGLTSEERTLSAGGGRELDTLINTITGAGKRAEGE